MIFLSFLLLLAQNILGPYSRVFNQPADLIGVPETRPCCWGYTASIENRYTFNPPVGYRVHILKIDGNYMAWARGVFAPGQHVGTSWGIVTSAVNDETFLPWTASNCFVYLEYALSNGEVNQPFKLDTSVGGRLPIDNSFTFVSAIYLSDAPIPIHMETTGVIIFQFEKIP